MRRLLIAATVGIVGTAAIVSTAWAQETGIASIHQWRKVGKKTCMVDHFHDGTANGGNRKAAERAAIADWVGFTGLEYGGAWASWRIAAAKSVQCSGGVGAVSCSVQAIPCRPY